jgi:phage-related minor tail protein
MALLDTLVVKLIGDITDFESKMDQAGSKWSSVGQKMTQTGAVMTAAVTAPLVAIGLKSIEAASNLAESMNKVDVVFGKNAETIKTWADGAAKALGQSEQQALEAAGTFGNLFTAMGIGSDQSTKMSTSIVELASDLASFNNIDPTVALEKLRAGLVGETEPLRTLGVNLSAAAVEAKAMEMGLVGANGELTAAAKAQAAYALILEQTKTAQGDFSRTSEGLANSTRIMKAELADAAANLGTMLLPIALKIVNVITSWIEKFQALSPETQKIILIVAGLAAAIGPVLVVAGTLISSVTAIMGAFAAAGPVIAGIGPILAVLTGPIGLVVLAVAALAAAWATNFGGIRDVTYAVFGAVRDFIGNAIQSIKNFFSGSWSDIGARMMQGIADGIRSAWNFVVDAARGAAEAALNAAKSALGISSPSKVAADQIGMPFAQGIREGAMRGIGALSADITRGLDITVGGIRPQSQISTAGAGGFSGNIPVTINISGNADESSVRRGAGMGVLDALRQVGLA